MRKRIEIGYVTEDPAPAYGKAIRKAKNKKELVVAIDFFMPIVDDALLVAEKMTDKDFTDFKRDLKKANDPKQPEKWVDEFVSRFGAIAMPYKMMMVSLMESQFHAPWGTCFIRFEELRSKKSKK